MRSEPLITRTEREREAAVLARIMADGGYPRVELIRGKAIWIYPFRAPATADR